MARTALNGMNPIRTDMHLDPMFTELYGIADYLRTPSYTGGSWKLAIDANGRIGIGGVPSSWGSGWTPVQFPTYGSMYETTAGIFGLGSNVYYNGTNWVTRSTNPSLLYSQDLGQGHVFYVNQSQSSGTNVTSWIGALSIDLLGNTKIKTQSVAASLTDNQQIAFQFISNTQLKILLRGSDGVTRGVTLTLS